MKQHNRSNDKTSLTTKQRYNELLKRYQESFHVEKFNEGYECYENIEILGHTKNMSAEQMQSLFIEQKNKFSVKILGALAHRIELVQQEENTSSSWSVKIAEEIIRIEEKFKKHVIDDFINSHVANNINEATRVSANRKRKVAKNTVLLMDIDDKEDFADEIARRGIKKNVNGFIQIKNETKKGLKTEIYDKAGGYTQAADGNIYFISERPYSYVEITKDGTVSKTHQGYMIYQATGYGANALGFPFEVDHLQEIRPIVNNKPEENLPVRDLIVDERLSQNSVRSQNDTVHNHPPNTPRTNFCLALGSSLRFRVLLTKDISRRIAAVLLELGALLSRHTNPRIADVFHEIEGSQWIRRCLDSLKKINLDKGAVPLFAQIQSQTDGTYRLPYIDSDQNIKYIVTTDASFSNLKQYLEKKAKALNQRNRLPSFLSSSLNKNANDVMSVILLVRQAIYLFRHIPETQESDPLHYALTIHLTVNRLQLIQGGLQTAESIFQTTRRVLEIAKPRFLEKSSTLLKLGKLPARALPVIGFTLDTADVSLTIYELTNAQNHSQRVIYGTQLVFSTTSLAISTATVAAMLLGTTTIVASLSMVAVPLIVVSMAVNHALSSYIKRLEMRKGLDAVRQYCDHITEGHDRGGYQVTHDLLLQPFDGVPITILNLQTGLVTFGTQHLHHSQQTSLSKIDEPGMSPEYLDIRSTLGHQIEASLPSAWRSAKHFVLPVVPNHKMYYVYTSIVKAISPANGRQSQLIRNTDKWFPTTMTHSKSTGKSTTKHYVVTEIATEYLATTITITLDNQTRYLHMPTSTTERLTKLTYQLQGAGGEYHLNLQPGVNVSLAEQAGSSSSSWVIDASLWQIKYTDMVVLNDRINIGAKELLINANKIKKLLICDVNKTLAEVDCTMQTIRLLKIDFIEWERSNLGKDLLSYLKTFEPQKFSGPYLVIENYLAHHRFIRIQGRDDIARTRAFYDVHHQRILHNYHKELFILKGPVFGHTYSTYHEILSDILQSIAFEEGISNGISNIDQRWKYFIELFVNHPLHELEERFKQRPDLAFMPLMKRFLYILQKTAVIESEQEEIFNLNIYSSQDQSTHFPLDENEDYALDDEQKKLRCARQIKTITIEDKKVARRFQYIIKWLKRVNQKMDLLSTLSERIKEAELVGIIDNYVYFYNKEKSAVWRTDLATGYQQIVFHFLFDAPLVKAWESKGTIQVEQKWTLANGHAGHLWYSIKNDQVSLIAIAGDHTFLSSLLNAQQDLQHFQQALKKQSVAALPLYTLAMSMSNDDRDTLYWFKSSPSIRRDEATDCWIFPREMSVQANLNSPIIPIFSDKEQKIVIRYWLRVIDNLIIKPNLPSFEEDPSSWTVPSDLVYVGALTQLELNRKEIFYFYSAEEKIIYRQEGPGNAHRSPDSPTALRINIPGLTQFFQHSDRLIALTEAGLVLKIDAAGQSHLLSTNQQWLEKQSVPWWQAAQTLAEQKKEVSFFIDGLKGIKTDEVPLNDNVQLAAWYYAGYVIVADNALRGQALELVYIDQQKKFAYLLNTTDGKLYKQAIPQAQDLATAFGNDHILDNADVLPSATWIITNFTFKSAHSYADNIRLITQTGEIFLLDTEEKLSLIGVDQPWQSNYSETQLIQACDQLVSVAKQNARLSETVLVLQRELNQAPKWYDCKNKRIIEAQGLTGADSPEWIGIDIDDSTAYVYSNTQQAIYKINGTHTTHLINLNSVKNLNHNQLAIVGTDNADVLAIPRIAGVDQIIYSGGSGVDSYQIDLDIWKHYSKILIHNFDAASTPEQDTLHLSVENQEHLIVYQENNDLAFCDIRNNRSVNISGVFDGDNIASRHLNIKLYQAGEPLLEQTIDALIHELSRYHSPSFGTSSQPFAYPLTLFPPITSSHS